MTKLLAWRGTVSKAQALTRIAAHEAADQIVSGTYGGDDPDAPEFRACAVGCSIRERGDEDCDDLHGLYEPRWGVPAQVARLEDAIFEGMWRIDAAAAKCWPRRFAEAIPEGADLSLVWPRFAAWLLREGGPVCRPEYPTDVLAAVRRVRGLHERRIETGSRPVQAEFAAAWSAAGAAARAAAGFAADSAAWFAARSAAGFAARSAARAAAESAARAARDAFWREAADQLIVLLASAPVNGGDN